MEEKIKSLQYKTKANDVDEEKGIVTVAVNGIGIEDSQHDISMPGSFNKTLKEGMNRMKWFLNHDTTQLLGVPLSGEEKDGNLVMVGQLNLDKQIGRDTLADYKLYAENGRTLEHSIGVQAIKRDKQDSRKVLEWKMWEYSTLTSWGSNPQTFLVNIKSASQDQVKDAIEFIRKAMYGHGYSDERLKSYDMEMNLLLKSLNGGNIVTCPYCGKQFDYDEQEEHTFSQQVLEYAAECQRWIAQGIVSEEMDKLKPEIREEVLYILDTVKSFAPLEKSEKDAFIEKALSDLQSFVRCPNCWTRVYKRNLLLQPKSSNPVEPSNDTQPLQEKEGEQPETKKAAESTFSFANINSCFTK